MRQPGEMAIHAPVLVVIGAPTIREIVVWIIQEMSLTSTLTANWRQAITAITEARSCIVADLDDVGDKTAGVAVPRKS